MTKINFQHVLILQALMVNTGTTTHKMKAPVIELSRKFPHFLESIKRGGATKVAHSHNFANIVDFLFRIQIKILAL
jgi:hypothetical protein